MSLASWNDHLSIGITLIDSDHRKLFELIDQLHDDVMGRKGRDVLAATLDQLVDSLIAHCSREERIFAMAGYPDIASHRREHEELVARTRTMQAGFKAGSDVVVSPEALKALNDWLVHHIQGIDRTYVPYVLI